MAIVAEKLYASEGWGIVLYHAIVMSLDLLSPPRRLCFVSIRLFVCLLATLLKKL